jgi:hypothetical protein
MKRFRTGRSAPPWAGGQTGPMTADVEALMSNRDRDPVKYVSPLNARREYAPPAAPVAETTPACAEAVVEAERVAETTLHAAAAGPVATVKLVYIPPDASPEEADAQVERAVADAERESLQRQATAVYPEPRRVAVPQTTRHPGVSTLACTEAVVEAERVAEVTPEAVLKERAERQSPKRKGTASAVPYSAKHSGVLTPEVYTETGSQVERATTIAPKRSHHKRKRAKRKPRPIPTLKQVTLRPAAPRKQSQPKSQTEIDLARHERRCSICHHPEREAIEEAFLQWRSVKSIDVDFEPEGGPTAIYRHARAFNLFKQRNLSLRSSLEFVIEQAEHVMPTAEGLVKAIRAYTRINDAGEWIDTPTTHIVKVMPMRDPEPRNVTPPYPAAGGDGELKNVASTVTLDVKQISNCPNGRKARGEGKVEVTIESPNGRPLPTGSAPQTEIDATT